MLRLYLTTSTRTDIRSKALQVNTVYMEVEDARNAYVVRWKNVSTYSYLGLILFIFYFLFLALETAKISAIFLLFFFRCDFSCFRSVSVVF